jgi:hypothetical protein
MTDDLRQRLDRLATELTETATIPPAASARRRGQRRQRRQLAVVAVVAVALTGIAVAPGAGLPEWGDTVAPAVGPPVTVAVPTLRPPRVAENEFAVTIQDPPSGFPERLRGRLLSRNCGETDTGAHVYRQLVIAEVRYRGEWRVFNVLPWPAVKEPQLQPQNLRAPWAAASRLRLDGSEDPRWPFLIAERPQTRLDLDRADGSKGSIVGAYRVVRGVRRGSATTVETVRGLTGAQLAMAWNCGNKP